MTKLSSALVEKKKMDRFYDDFCFAVTLLDNKEKVESFFFDLLTHTERKMLAKRLQVAIMLVEGHDYPTIRSSLKVTDVTIAKINNWLNTGADGLLTIAKRLASWKGSLKNEERNEGERRRYLAGDLLLPAVEAGVKLATRQLKKRRQRK